MSALLTLRFARVSPDRHRFEYRSAEGLSLEDSIVNRTSKSLSHGVGVRVCAEDRTGYAYSDEVTVDRMRLAAEAAKSMREPLLFTGDDFAHTDVAIA